MQKTYAVMAILAMGYIGYLIGSGVVNSLIQNYVRRTVILRYGKKMRQIGAMNRVENAQVFLDVFGSTVTRERTSNLLAECAELGVSMDELVHVLNTQCGIAGCRWSFYEDGLVLTGYSAKIHLIRDTA